MFTSAHNTKHGSVCCIPSKTHLCLGRCIVNGCRRRERREGCPFIPGVEDRSHRRQLCACYGPAQTVSGRAFLLRSCFSLSLQPGLKGSRTPALRPRERAPVRPRERAPVRPRERAPALRPRERAPVRPRERDFARKICLRGLPLPQVTGGRHFTLLSGLLLCVQYRV